MDFEPLNLTDDGSSIAITENENNVIDYKDVIEVDLKDCSKVIDKKDCTKNKILFPSSATLPFATSAVVDSSSNDVSSKQNDAVGNKELDGIKHCSMLEDNSCDKNEILFPSSAAPRVAAVIEVKNRNSNACGDITQKSDETKLALKEDEVGLLLDDDGLLDNETPCLMCDYVESDVDSNKKHWDEYLCHLVVCHHIVIGDVKLVKDLRNYALHWKNRLKQAPIEEFCTKILTNCGPKDQAKKEEYYLLCHSLPEDLKVRQQIHMNKLKQMLLRHEFERKDTTFERTCLFCSKQLIGNRLQLFNHMTSQHGFNVGHPDNIVNVNEFLDLIESKLESLQCLLCENKFNDKLTLREHMRKKLHRKLNPKNKEYDKFYLINYLQFGMNWEEIHHDHVINEDEKDDWSGWVGKLPVANCFFCSERDCGTTSVYDHMTHAHDFDFIKICHDMQMSFYQQVKMINFIRAQTASFLREHNMESSDPDVINEVVTNVKEKIGDREKWNKPQFYFPTIADDALLYGLVENQGLFEPEDTHVFSEDIDFHKVIDASILTELVVNGSLEDGAYYNQQLIAATSDPPPYIFPWNIEMQQ